MIILVLSAKGGGTGCALRARYIAEAFEKRGHQVHFIKPIPSLPLWFDMVLSAFYYFWISLWVKSDVAIAIKPYPTVVPGLFVQKCKGAKVTIDVDDLDYDYSHGWFRALHKWLQEPWPKWADLVTYHNPHLREPLQKVFKVPAKKLVCLPQGVDGGLFHPGPLKMDDLPRAGAALKNRNGKGPILTFTAHLSVACDLEPLMESFKLIQRSLPGVQLLVAGGGPDEGRFKRLALDMGIAPAVHFTGYLTPRQVAACLKLSDAALVYYKDSSVNQYRASMKLREAIACGCRVVAADVGETILFKKALFPSPPNPAAFSKAVLRALKARKSPREAALLVKTLDWTRCIQDLEERLRQLCVT